MIGGTLNHTGPSASAAGASSYPLAQPARSDPNLARIISPPSSQQGAGPRQRMVISHLVLRNFKSYAGEQLIGPFHKSFSSVVGPNGSGKSNVIDALLFVFGYRASKMRQAKIGHLIHKSEAFPDLPQCTVEVHFEDILESMADDTTTIVPDTQLVVARTATRSHASRYTINGAASSYTDVTALLRGKGIDLDHNRFLILQGEVESIAQMKPRGTGDADDGLLEYLEDIIGTAQYKAPLATARRELDALSDARTAAVARVRLVELEVAALADGRAAAESYLKAEAQVRRAQARIARHHARRHRHGAAAAGAAADEARRLLADLETATAAADHVGEAAALEVRESAARNAAHAAHAVLEPAARAMAALAADDVRVREQRKAVTKRRDALAKAAATAARRVADGAAEIAALADTAAARAADQAAVADELAAARSVVDDLAVTVRAKARDLQADMDARKAAARPVAQQLRERRGHRTTVTSAHARAVAAAGGTAAAQERLGTAERDLAGQQSVLAAEETTLVERRDELMADQATQKAAHAALAASHEAAHVAARKAAVAAEDSRRALEHARRSRGAQLSALLDLKTSQWPGLMDRLGELGSIPAKYDVAVSTAVGSLNCLVVDSVGTGEAILDFLRVQRLGRARLIVLDKLARRDLAPIDTPENVPRLFDLVEIKGGSDPLRQAFYFAMKNTLVADTLEQARRVAFAGKRRWRVVTLAGELIEASGAMSGGGSRVIRGRMKLSGELAPMSLASSSRARKNNDDDDDDDELESVTEESVAAREQARADTHARLAELSREVDAAVSGLEQNAHQLAAVEADLARVRAAQVRVVQALERTRAELTTVTAGDGDDMADGAASSSNNKRKKANKATKPDNADALAQQLEAVDADIAALEATQAEMTSAMAAIQAKIDEAGGAKYKKAKAALAEMESLADQATRDAAKAQAAHNQAERSVAAAHQTLAESEAAKAAIDEQLADLQAQLADLEERALPVADAVDDAKAAVAAAETALAEVQTRQRALEAEVARFAREQAELVATVDQVVRKLAFEQQQMAVWGSKLVEIKESAAATRAALRVDGKSGGDDDLDTIMDVDTDGPVLTQVPADNDADESMDLWEQLGLGDGLDDQDADDETDFDEPALQREIKQLKSELAGQQVNLGELLEHQARLRELARRASQLVEAEQRRDEHKQVTDALLRARLTAFMTGFSEISLRLKDMYSLITSGGNAELELVDSMDPFAEGIVFSVMPPRKSWKQIANLSGGERTLASLALVFALQAYRPTPLYVLDEIDAALDFRNVSIIANYVREQSQGPHAAQFIIISLRHNMFELADRLVGIYKVRNCTRAVTISPSEVAAAIGIPSETSSAIASIASVAATSRAVDAVAASALNGAAPAAVEESQLY
ncbi:RecF/RecN/SMC [Blastocladiella britannica]|nr:RecF/RecN/SMC [Blastocladiella britannica]